MSDKNLFSAMRNADASVHMDGFEVTPKMQEQCSRVLDGDSSTVDALRQLLSEHEYQNLRDALASTRMEGYEVTEQTEIDCVRLLSKKLSLSDLVEEIMKRLGDNKSENSMEGNNERYCK